MSYAENSQLDLRAERGWQANNRVLETIPPMPERGENGPDPRPGPNAIGDTTSNGLSERGVETGE